MYDSILREYPIGTLLVWKTKGLIKRRKFIDNYKHSLKLIDFYVPEDSTVKMMVLDGQQRLQSLFIGLKGSYDGKELYFNVLSGDLRAPEDIKFEFRFLQKEDAGFPWVKFKELVFTDKKRREIFNSITDDVEELSGNDTERVDDNIDLVREVFCTQENILYQLVDSIDRPDSYKEDDIVEIFIRANSGGTKLGKSDLLFSLLAASWENAETNMHELLEDLNRTGYQFSRDFVLKTCLVLLNKGARYQVEKFRDEITRNRIEEDWVNIANAIKAVKDFIYGNTFLKTDKTIPSYLSLIPMIYFRYHFKDQWKVYEVDYQKYISRVSLTGVFGGSPDNLLNKIVNKINELAAFNLSEIYGIIREDGRSLEVSKDTIMGLHYSSKEIHLFFNMWYGFNYQPALHENSPQIDHIFPQSALKKIKLVNPETGAQNIMKYKWWDRDQLGNLMLLTAAENGAGGKTDTLPEDWFADKDEAYLNLHLIPKDTELWKMENFERFLEARRQLILEKFKYLIYQNQPMSQAAGV